MSDKPNPPRRATLPAFDAAKHPRGRDGEFAGERRSLTRGETWQRLGAKLPGLPSGYTGSRDKERPAGSFERLSITHQILPGMTPEEHHARFRAFLNIAKANRKQIIEEGIKNRKGEKHVYLKSNETKDGKPRWRFKPDKFPEGTPRSVLNRAYDHATLLAIHDHGPIHYDFKMDEHLKHEMEPVAPFIQYVRRRVSLEIHKQHKGHRIEYQRAFGTPFRDHRKHLGGANRGEVRRRLAPNQTLVKGWAARIGRGIEEASQPSEFSVPHLGGRALGSLVGRKSRVLATAPLRFVRETTAEGAHFGGGVAGALAHEWGAGPKWRKRFARTGAVVGGAKTALLMGLVGNAGFHAARRALRSKQQQISPADQASPG